MNSTPCRLGRAARRTIAGAVGIVVLAGCDASPRRDASATADTGAAVERYQPAGDEGLGVSVVIVLDNSGSMREKASGDKRRKFEVAKIAIERALDATEAALTKRPDYPVKVSLISFSDETQTVLEMQPYNRDSVRAAIGRLTRPSGGTAIGDAMDVARQALYKAGTFRKVMLVVTDGENTDGRDPADVAREIFARSDGGVGMYFVAFDTDKDKFGFLRDVKGDVVSAQNGAALEKSFAWLYEGKVLAESTAEPSPDVNVLDSVRPGPVKTTPRSPQ
ncbi:MAG: vWA domain-containing protein [Gemmatimonadaceae bacterium]